MKGLRLVRRLALLLGTTVYCVLRHRMVRRSRRSPWPQHFLGRAAKAAGCELHISGTPRLHDVFYVANHMSWLDILLLGGATGCAFISKDSVARAPVLGWLAGQNNTIFVAREKRGEVAAHVALVRAAVERHQPIALFAEGGTGDGTTLRPFKPPLFSVLLPPPRAIRIQPVLIDYGESRNLVAWGDESGVTNACRILSSPGRRRVTLHFLDPFDPGDHADRKQLAAETHRRMAEAWAELEKCPTERAKPARR
jgi:1-acyl-sn-glycerol-3-phosphate acyltransferase